MKKAVVETKSAPKSETSKSDESLTVTLDGENARLMALAAERNIPLDVFINQCVRDKCLSIKRDLAAKDVAEWSKKAHRSQDREQRALVKQSHESDDLPILARHIYDACMTTGETIEVTIDAEIYKRMAKMGRRLCSMLDTGNEWGNEMIVNAALRNFFRPVGACG